MLGTGLRGPVANHHLNSKKNNLNLSNDCGNKKESASKMKTSIKHQECQQMACS